MQEAKDMKTSILQMARGAFEERVDYEMNRVVDNIIDPNTKATAKRKVTLTLDLIPDETRQQIQVHATVKSTLAATSPVSTSLYITSDEQGEMTVVEMVPQVPGQMKFDGTEQEQPKIMKLARQA